MRTTVYSIGLAILTAFAVGLSAYAQTSTGSSGLGWNRGGTVVTNDQNFVMIGNTPDATNERSLVGDGSTIQITDNGPNGTVVLSIIGPLIQSAGGTGFSTYTAGDILVANNAGALVKLALGADGTVLTVDTSLNPKVKWAAAGAGTVTSFSAGNLAPLFTTSVANATTTPSLTFTQSTVANNSWFGNVSGGVLAPSFNTSAIPIVLGGTGQTTATAAFDALAPTTTQADLIVHDGTNNVRLAKGTANQVLGMNSAATAHEYKTITAGTNISVTHGANSITINNTAPAGVTSVGATGPASILSWTGTPVTTTGTLTAAAASVGAYTVMGNNTSASAAWAAQSMVTEQTPQAVAAVPGGNTSVRSLPTSGTLTGDYFHYGNWTSGGIITCNRCRITVIGTIQLDHAITVNTELSGGTAGAAVAGSAAGAGIGLGAGNPGISTGANVQAGGGGGFGGDGGAGGTGAAGDRAGRGGKAYDINQQLFGSSAGGGVANAAVANGAGGAGGGGILIQATGNITINANITATGGAGGDTTANSSGAGGGGSGGGVDIRSLGTVTINAAKTINVSGGRGGNVTGSTAGGGGGGGGGYVAVHGSTVTNNGTITLTGGNAGTGSAGQAATAGSSGTSLVESGTVWYLRQY